MLAFGVAVMLVMGVGFQTTLDAPSGEDPIAQMQASAQEIAMVLAKAVMYVAPGALTVFYAIIAFDGVSAARAAKLLK